MIKKILSTVFTIWCIISFSIGFLISLTFYIFLYIKPLWPFVHRGIKLWGTLTFSLAFIPIKIIHKSESKRKGLCIYCANHTSYFDIPTLFHAIPGYFSIIGKAELNKIPLFGWMFKQLYIPVDRKTKKGRLDAYVRVKETIEENRSVIFFAEGTIPPREQHPRMIDFKEGPFRAAIEAQIPIVPVTLPYLWIIFGHNGKKTRARWHQSKVIIHESIPTKGLTLDDLDTLRAQTKRIIEEELIKHNPNAYR